jgi:hypothetical protein
MNDNAVHIRLQDLYLQPIGLKTNISRSLKHSGLFADRSAFEFKLYGGLVGEGTIPYFNSEVQLGQRVAFKLMFVKQ